MYTQGKNYQTWSPGTRLLWPAVVPRCVGEDNRAESASVFIRFRFCFSVVSKQQTNPTPSLWQEYSRMPHSECIEGHWLQATADHYLHTHTNNMSNNQSNSCKRAILQHITQCPAITRIIRVQYIRYVYHTLIIFQVLIPRGEIPWKKWWRKVTQELKHLATSRKYYMLIPIEQLHKKARWNCTWFLAIGLQLTWCD